MMQLISQNGRTDKFISAEQLATLCQLQPLDFASWGNTAYMRRHKFVVHTNPVWDYPSGDFEIPRSYVLCLDEGGSLEELLPVSNTIVLDLQERFEVRVTSFKHAGDRLSKAYLTVVATADQLRAIQQAYPKLREAK